MKKIISIILILSVRVQAADTQSWLVDNLLANSHLTRAALSGLSTQRCIKDLRPLGANISESGNKSCRTLLRDFSRALDLESVRQEKTRALTVVFRQDFLNILNDARMDYFLRQLQNNIDMARAYEYEFSIIDSVRPFVKDNNEALLWIGVLLQDITLLRAHIQWAAKQNLNSDQSYRLKGLNEVLDSLWDAIIPGSGTVGKIHFYPKELNLEEPSDKNLAFYHFYVPALIALKVDQLGYSKEISVYTAYHFNFLYEAMNESLSTKLAWEDPLQLQNQASAVDSYLGLRGGLYALAPKHDADLPSGFIKALMEDVPRAHRQLVRWLIWYFSSHRQP